MCVAKGDSGFYNLLHCKILLHTRAEKFNVDCSNPLTVVKTLGNVSKESCNERKLVKPSEKRPFKVQFLLYIGENRTQVFCVASIGVTRNVEREGKADSDSFSGKLHGHSYIVISN